jgi:hypothetical protein
MKKQADKLTLKRETIRPLTTNDLSDVAGGQRPISVKSYVISSHPSYCCGDTVATTGGD